MATSTHPDQRASLQAQLSAASSWTGDGELVLETGLAYRTGEPVELRLRRRGHFVHLDDSGEAVERASRPGGWLDVAERVVAADGFNVNRRGVVFVAVGRGRDLAPLALRLAESSLGVYLALLDLQEIG